MTPLPLCGISPRGENNWGGYLNYDNVPEFFPLRGELKGGILKVLNNV